MNKRHQHWGTDEDPRTRRSKRWVYKKRNATKSLAGINPDDLVHAFDPGKIQFHLLRLLRHLCHDRKLMKGSHGLQKSSSHRLQCQMKCFAVVSRRSPAMWGGTGWKRRYYDRYYSDSHMDYRMRENGKMVHVDRELARSRRHSIQYRNYRSEIQLDDPPSWRHADRRSGHRQHPQMGGDSVGLLHLHEQYE